MVRFRDNADSLSRLNALSDESASTVKRLGLPGLQLVHVSGSVTQAVAALESNPAVAYAEPNYLYHATALPNDPRYSQLWGMAKISAPSAWNITTGSAAVKVAVVDTGIATDHLDLSSNVAPGYDFVQGDSDPRDYNGHGTHVAGTIGARGNNAIGVTGVNWQVGLMPVRVLDGNGSGSNANVTAGFAYACAHGASDRQREPRRHRLLDRHARRDRSRARPRSSWWPPGTTASTTTRRRTTPATTAPRRTTSPT